jgi:hypothetical protein
MANLSTIHFQSKFFLCKCKRLLSQLSCVFLLVINFILNITVVIVWTDKSPRLNLKCIQMAEITWNGKLYLNGNVCRVMVIQI